MIKIKKEKEPKILTGYYKTMELWQKIIEALENNLKLHFEKMGYTWNNEIDFTRFFSHHYTHTRD